MLVIACYVREKSVIGLFSNSHVFFTNRGKLKQLYNKGDLQQKYIHSLIFTRMLFFRARLNILIFLPILG